MTYDKWINTIKDKHVRSYIPIKSLNDRGAVQKSVAFMQSFPLAGVGQPAATAVIVMDENVIKEEINKVKWMDEGTIFIIDSHNNVIASTGTYNLPQPIKYEELGKDYDILHEKINGKPMVVSYVSSKVSDWKYVSVLPKEVFLQKAQHVRKVTYISILLCLLIGILAAYFLTKMNYNPVGRLIQIITNKGDKRTEGKYVGYDFIEESILGIIDEDQKIHERLEQQNDVIRNSFLCKLLKGQIKPEDTIEDACESNDIKFTSEYFASMLFYVEAFDINSIGSGSSQVPNGDVLKNIYIIIGDTIQEMIGERSTSYMAEVDEMLCCLINVCDEEKEKIQEDMLAIAEMATDFIEEKFNIYFTVSISDIHKGYEEIPETYKEAIDAFEYKRLMGGGKIIQYTNINALKDPEAKYEFGAEKQKQFTNFIMAGEYNKAKEVLDSVFLQSFSVPFASVQMVKCRMFGIINTMLNIMEELSIVCDKQFLDKLNIADRLLNCVTIKQLQNEMDSILDELSEYMERKSQENSTSIKDDIVSFIESNYENPNLSVSMVADEIGVSDVHLTRVFKKETGSGVLEYIHRVRIEKAKELMKQKNISIKDVAEKVGYYNSVAFIRVFKKYEGITPGKYAGMQ